jgi:hypothetical protein
MINVCEIPVDKDTYPALKISDDLGTVVLFHKPCCGIVVKGSKFNRLGEYSEGWAEDYCFKPYTQALRLENA